MIDKHHGSLQFFVILGAWCTTIFVRRDEHPPLWRQMDNVTSTESSASRTYRVHYRMPSWMNSVSWGV